MSWISTLVRVVSAVVPLVPVAKDLYDEIYRAKYGMTRQEALAKKADINRRHKEPRK